MGAWDRRFENRIEKELAEQKTKGILEAPSAYDNGHLVPPTQWAAGDVRASIPPLGLREYWYPALPAEQGGQQAAVLEHARRRDGLLPRRAGRGGRPDRRVPPPRRQPVRGRLLLQGVRNLSLPRRQFRRPRRVYGLPDRGAGLQDGRRPPRASLPDADPARLGVRLDGRRRARADRRGRAAGVFRARDLGAAQ